LVLVRWPRTGQAAAVADATVAIDRLEALQVARDLAAEIALHAPTCCSVMMWRILFSCSSERS
jgi:hypothetical protein